MKNRPARTLGVFTAELNDSYQAFVWEGISTQAYADGLGLICFLGSRLNSPITPERSANHIYDLANERNLDGLIVVSSAISTYLEADTLARFVAARGSLPLVSIGLKVPGVPSVTVDGKTGFATIVQHVIEEHQRRDFALVAGPLGHDEADDRKKTFFETLKQHGIPFNERLCFEGTFEKGSGAAAVKHFIGTGERFDAVVCLNDKMALGVLDELSDQGLDVPHEISLVGFDGIKMAEYSNPSITTVVQPIQELGSEAVRMITALLDARDATGSDELDDRVLGCTPRIRESCGCRRSLDPPSSGSSDSSKGFSDHEKALERTLLGLASTFQTDDFLAELGREVSRSLQKGDRIDWFLALVYRIQHQIVENAQLVTSAANRGTLSELFTEAYIFLGEAHSRYEASKRIRAIEQASEVRAVSIAISEEFEIPVVLNQLFSGLESLGFDESYLVLYEGVSEPHTWSRLFSSSGAARGDQKGLRFRTESILPGDPGPQWWTRHWVMLPLVFQSEALGYLLLPAHVLDPEHYRTLSKQLASTLKGRRLLEQVRNHERSLEEEVARRTTELVGANEQLTEEIQRRILLEREVTDTSNMIMERIGQDLHDDLCQHLAGISMMVSAFKRASEPGSSTARFAGQISSLLVNSIDLARGIARSLAPVGLREEGLAVAVDALIESIRKRYGTRIQFHHDDEFRSDDIERSVQLYRIVQEALMNAVKHSRCTRIDVRLAVINRPDTVAAGNNGSDRKCFLIEVKDDGVGLPARTSRDGMGMRIMHYRAEMVHASLEVKNLEPEGMGTKVSCTFS